MASSSNSSIVDMEDESTNRPPLFDGTNYLAWSNRMSIYMRSCDYEMWDIVMDGPYVSIKTKEEVKNWCQSFEVNGQILDRKSVV